MDKLISNVIKPNNKTFDNINIKLILDEIPGDYGSTIYWLYNNHNLIL